MVPVVSGVSLLQHVKAETSGQDGKDGTYLLCSSPSICYNDGGMGGSGNGPNYDESSNGNVYE
jgi:hypothetical protein